MGKLTEALKATKELRKQFKKPAEAKKLTAKAQKVQDHIYKGEPFGCNTPAVAILMGLMTGETIVKRTSSSAGRFDTVKGALVKYTGTSKDSNGFLIEDEGQSILRWRDRADGNCSSHRELSCFKPATDAEIKKFYS